MELTLTKSNFKSEVLESKIPVLVDFWASWCGPCKMMGPVVSEIAEEKQGSIKVGKVNVDEQPDLANMFKIHVIPTVIVIKNGEIAATSVGYKEKNEFLKLVK